VRHAYTSTTLGKVSAVHPERGIDRQDHHRRPRSSTVPSDSRVSWRVLAGAGRSDRCHCRRLDVDRTDGRPDLDFPDVLNIAWV